MIDAPFLDRHSREGGNPSHTQAFELEWIPAFAGMTEYGVNGGFLSV